MGLKALSEQISIGRRAYTFPMGFRGISEAFADDTRFIRVQTARGIPLAGVTVTVQNTGGPITSLTDSTGTAVILPDTGQVVTIDLRQHMTEVTGIEYDTDNEEPVRVLVLDNIIPHL